MALRPCSACGHMVSGDAEACPACGRGIMTVKKRREEMLFRIAYGAIIVLYFIGFAILVRSSE